MAAAPEPPCGFPRISEVFDPGGKFYEVLVRLDARTASQFLEKPYGLPLEEVGKILGENVSRYEGYVCVKISGGGGADETFWHFQKLDGPVWTTRTRSRENAVPALFRAQVLTTQTKQDVVTGTQPSTLTGNMVASKIEEPENTGLAVRTEVTEEIDTNANPFYGQKAYIERELAFTAQQLVLDGTPADTGLLICQSTVSPNGDGKSTKDSITVPRWSRHTAARWNDRLSTQIQRTEQFVAPGDGIGEPYTSLEIVNKDRSLKIVESIPTEAIEAYHHIMPNAVEIQHPNVLHSIKLVVNRNLANGNSIGTGSSFSLHNQSNVAVAADFVFEMDEGIPQEVDGEVHEFYLKNPTRAAVAGRCGATPWPYYAPKTVRVAAASRSQSQSVEMSVSQSGQSLSESSQVGASVQTQVLPAFLCAGLPIEIEYHDTEAPTGIADAIMDQMAELGAKRLEILQQALDNGERMFGVDTSGDAEKALVQSYLDLMKKQNALATDLKLSDFPVTCTPSSIPATSIPRITPGRYMKKSSIEDAEYGYFLIRAQVVIIP